MADVELAIVDGPTKPDLQWAVAYPERHLHIHFDTGKDAVDAHLDEMQEMGDGTRFALKGHLTSGLYKGWPFKAVYDLATRSGVIKAQDPGQGRDRHPRQSGPNNGTKCGLSTAAQAGVAAPSARRLPYLGSGHSAESHEWQIWCHKRTQIAA